MIGGAADDGLLKNCRRKAEKMDRGMMGNAKLDTLSQQRREQDIARNSLQLKGKSSSPILQRTLGTRKGKTSKEAGGKDVKIIAITTQQNMS